MLLEGGRASSASSPIFFVLVVVASVLILARRKKRIDQRDAAYHAHPIDDPAKDATDEEFDDDPQPPTPRRVAQRALVLSALTYRSALENEAGRTAEALRAEILGWLTTVGARDEVESSELRLLEAPVGTLTDRQRVDASWRGEGLAVLAWALGRAELPSYQSMVNSPHVADTLDFMKPAASLLVDATTLRTPSELAALTKRLFALHWRLREFSLRRKPMDFATFARTATFGPLDITGLELVDGDLAIDGRPLIEVAEARWRECLSIAAERHQAANWLRGDDTLYTDVTADT